MEDRRIALGTRALIYANIFLVGSVLMGYEMLGSRYLYPYFGGGTGTWASLISMVLFALTIGYFVGGYLVDKMPSTNIMAAAIMGAAAYLALVPMSADSAMVWTLDMIGDGPTGILLAAALITLVPVALLGMLSPVFVRLLIHSTTESGRVSGFVYGLSTVGNVVGTLFTTFYLIPMIGSREITYLFAAILAACSLSLFIFRPKLS